MLEEELTKIIKPKICSDRITYTAYTQRLTERAYTRDENARSHFCVYFLPFNSKKGEVFIVHHKKSGLWLSPGGHIDRGEILIDTVNREIKEELGVESYFKKLPQ